MELERLQKKLVGTSSSVHTRSNQSTADLVKNKHFFCAGSEGLHNAFTYNIDEKVWRYALEPEDTALLAKLVPGDMIALEAKY